MKPIIRVGITHGDFNGVGYEVILKALDNPMMFDICTPVLYGSAKIASFYRKMLDLPQQPYQQIKDASQARDGQLNIINVIGEDAKVEPGVISKTAGAAALAALDQATADLRDGKIDVLVTAPISKNAIRSDEFTFPGHTEYLEQRLAPESEGEEKSEPARAMMILFNEHVRVALATVHLPISQVSAAITRDHLTDCIIRLNHTLRSDFGIKRP
ncbi:MAG: 4-hydroxythreonine-4-phosphate dehydrogenase PdxA, partial [Paramuribaculum sp.]|nr:4-hydroxythreonine-4-phosphate dehydrogenase PdxA [Paramuribaculum sp.]